MTRQINRLFERRREVLRPNKFASASMLQDMTKGVLDPRVTFTRASSATRVNAAGLIESVSTNVPRFDYDPVTLACKGLLIEEQRTNLLQYSQDQSNAYWTTKTNVTDVATTTIDPSGGQSARRITCTASSGSFGKSQTLTSGVPYVMSAWVRLVSGGSIVSMIVGDNVDSPNIPISDAWTRISYTATPTTTTVRAYVSPVGLGQVIEIFGLQLEQASFPTSYIPTTSAQVTRSADVATMTGTNFSSWYNQSEGTLFAESVLSRQNAAGGTGIVTIDDSTVLNSNGLFYRASGATGVNIQVAGVTQFDASPTSAIAANAVLKFAIAYKSNDCAASGNGGAVSTGGGSVPTVNRLEIGYRPSAAYLNGHIRRIAYFPRRLANSELQALTS